MIRRAVRGTVGVLTMCRESVHPNRHRCGASCCIMSGAGKGGWKAPQTGKSKGPGQWHTTKFMDGLWWSKDGESADSPFWCSHICACKGLFSEQSTWGAATQHSLTPTVWMDGADLSIYLDWNRVACLTAYIQFKIICPFKGTTIALWASCMITAVVCMNKTLLLLKVSMDTNFVLPAIPVTLAADIWGRGVMEGNQRNMQGKHCLNPVRTNMR